MQINDCVVEALGDGQIEDLLLDYYHINGGVGDDIRDAEYSFLLVQGVSPAQLNDMWFQLLQDKGYIGALDDMLYQFWCEDGGSLLLRASRGWSGPENCTSVDDTLVTIRYSQIAFYINGSLGITITHSNGGIFTVTGVTSGGTALLSYTGSWNIPLGGGDTITFTYDEVVGDYVDEDTIPMESHSLELINCLSAGTWLDELGDAWVNELDEEWTTT